MDEPSYFPSDVSILEDIHPVSVLATPREALRTTHFRLNWIIGTLVTFGINFGVAYGTLADVVAAGLWTKPDRPDGDTTMMWSDLLLTGALVCFFTNLLGCPGIRGAVKKGKVTPVADELLMRGIYRYFPVRFEQNIVRGLLFAIEFQAIYVLPTMLVFAVACQAGWMTKNEYDNTCEIQTMDYVWFKGFWAAGMAFFAYPFIYLGALNRKRIPDEVYDQFLGRSPTVGADLLQPLA